MSAPRQVSQFDRDTGELIQTFEHVGEAERETGVSKTTIREVASGKKHYAGGFIWTYEDPNEFTPPTPEQVEQKKFENRSKGHAGTRHSQETRDKMSVAKIGRQRSQETRDKISRARAGKNARAKMRQAHSNTPKEVFQYTLPDLEFVQKHPSISKAGKTVNCTASPISQVISDKYPHYITAQGYHWSDHLLTEEEKQPIRAKLLKSSRFKKQHAPSV